LQTESTNAPYRGDLTVIGHGQTENSTGETLNPSTNESMLIKKLISASKWLLKANIQEVSLTECQRLYNGLTFSSLKGNVIRSQICARDDNKISSADTCQGEKIEKNSNEREVVDQSNVDFLEFWLIGRFYFYRNSRYVDFKFLKSYRPEWFLMLSISRYVEFEKKENQKVYRKNFFSQDTFALS
jgi:hypothetical protein